MTITDPFDGSITAVTALGFSGITRSGGIAEMSGSFGGYVCYNEDHGTNDLSCSLDFDCDDIGEATLVVASDGVYTYPFVNGYNLTRVGVYIFLRRCVSGSGEQLAQETVGLSGVRELKLEVVDGVVKGYVDGVEQISYTDASPLTGTKVAFGWAYNQSGTPTAFQPFIGGPISAPPTIPDAVIDLAGTIGDQQVALTWTAPDDGGSAITDYVVQWREA